MFCSWLDSYWKRNIRCFQIIIFTTSYTRRSKDEKKKIRLEFFERLTLILSMTTNNIIINVLLNMLNTLYELLWPTQFASKSAYAIDKLFNIFTDRRFVRSKIIETIDYRIMRHHCGFGVVLKTIKQDGGRRYDNIIILYIN